jgi:hypothetical protein
MARPIPFALTALLLALALASPLAARPGRIVTKDGKTWEGDVTENAQQGRVNVVIKGQTHTFLRGNVDRIEYSEAAPDAPAAPAQPQPPAPGQPQPGATMTAEEQEFQKRRTAIANSDVNGLLTLARWAFDRQQYDLAHDAAQDAQNADPRNQAAADLLRTIDAQRRLSRRSAAGGQQPAPGRQPPPGQQPDPRDDNPRPPRAPGQGNDKAGGDNGLIPPLSPDEVNRIRLLEWRGDRGVKIRLVNDVKRRYLARANMQPAEFNKLDAVDQAWEMKKKGSPELLNDIRMTNDPPALQQYRTIVQRTVLTGCATTACHGGGAGSDKFALHARADHEGEAYANFLTLHKYQYKPGKGREAAMIDRNRPEDSVLIQFGLAPNISNMPHPDVEGYRPVFRTLNDPKYRQFVRWIADDLSPLIEDYGVPFEDAAQPHPPRAQPAGSDQPPADPAPPANQGSRAPAGQQPDAVPPPAPQGPPAGAPRPRPPAR